MSEDISEVKIFEMVYRQHPNASIAFIQKEALKIQIALEQNKMFMKGYLEVPDAIAQEVQTIAAINPPKSVDRGSDNADSEPVKVKKLPDGVVLNNVSTWKINTPEGIQNSIGENFITCCICGRNDFKSLSRHLKSHGMDAEEYIRLCGFPSNTRLMAKTYYDQTAKRMRKTVEPETSEENKAPAEDQNNQFAQSMSAPQNPEQQTPPAQNSEQPYFGQGTDQQYFGQNPDQQNYNQNNQQQQQQNY